MNTNKIVGLLILVALAVFLIPKMAQVLSPEEVSDTYTISVTSNTNSDDIDRLVFKEWVSYWVGNQDFYYFSISIGSETYNAFYVIFDSSGVNIKNDDGELLLVNQYTFRFDLIDTFNETYPNVITITAVLEP